MWYHVQNCRDTKETTYKNLQVIVDAIYILYRHIQNSAKIVKTSSTVCYETDKRLNKTSSVFSDFLESELKVHFEQISRALLFRIIGQI